MKTAFTVNHVLKFFFFSRWPSHSGATTTTKTSEDSTALTPSFRALCIFVHIFKMVGVSRWFIFKPKILIWVIFGVPYIGWKKLIYLMGIWNILQIFVNFL
jgi:hypothetical protein